MDPKQDEMATENSQRQKINPAPARNSDEMRAGATRLPGQLVAELIGAIEDHRKWIDSARARTLGRAFEVTGRLLTYGAYLALAYLAITSFLDIRSGIASGVYAIPEEIGGSRIALFHILAAGLVGPIAIIGIGIGVGWVYNLTVASANQLLPRFMRPLIHPSIMLVVVAAFSVYQSVVSSKVASGYLYAQANIAAASPQQPDTEKVIEIPTLGDADVADQNSSSERELLRLKSMFNNRRPCSNGDPGPGLNPQAEGSRPEPGLAPGSDCPAEITNLPENRPAGP